MAVRAHHRHGANSKRFRYNHFIFLIFVLCLAYSIGLYASIQEHHFGAIFGGKDEGLSLAFLVSNKDNEYPSDDIDDDAAGALNGIDDDGDGGVTALNANDDDADGGFDALNNIDLQGELYDKAQHLAFRQQFLEGEKEKEPPKFVEPCFPHPEHLKLPKPIINVGFPKAGTSTIFNFFHCNGLKGQHWYCCEDQTSASKTANRTLMSRCILENIVKNRQIFQGCGDYEFYSEINGPRRLGGLKNKEYNDRNILDDGTIESKAESNKRPRILLPQHHYLDRIHEQFPDATFILNLRPVDDWVKSVINWPTNLKLELPYEFFAQHKNGNLTASFGKDIEPPAQYRGLFADEFLVRPKQLAGLLKYFYNYHSEHVREFVKQHPSHTLIEVNITHDNAGRVLADAFGLNETCWGHFNKNKHAQKKNGKGMTAAKVVALRRNELMLKRKKYRQAWMEKNMDEKEGSLGPGLSKRWEKMMKRQRANGAIAVSDSEKNARDHPKAKRKGRLMGGSALTSRLEEFMQGRSPLLTREPKGKNVKNIDFDWEALNEEEKQQQKKILKEELIAQWKGGQRSSGQSLLKQKAVKIKDSFFEEGKIQKEEW